MHLSKIKKITLFLLLAVFSFFIAKNALAYTSTGNYQQTFEKSVYGTDQINQPSFGKAMFETVTATAIGEIIGCTTQDCVNKVGANGGALGGVSNLIAAMYANPPASSGQYLADLGRNLGIVQPAYAANENGFGFSKLNFILPVWKVFRDITYVFFAIVFVVIGFAIMFRLKLSPQAVVTVQSAIPGIVIALLLVTFSYAIASLLIDFMYVITLLVLGAFQQAGLSGVAVKIDGGFFELLKDVFRASGNWGTVLLGGGAITVAIAGALALFSVNPAVVAILGIGGGLIVLILSAILLYVVIKTFFSLLGSYIAILFAIIFGPFQIMLGAIPGQSGFGNWFRNLIANIAVFPAVMIYLYVCNAIINQSTLGKPVWSPPLVGGSLSAFLPFILGFGMLLVLPKVPDMVKDALKVPAFKYGTAIGEALGAPARMSAQALKTTSRVVTGASEAARGIKYIRGGGSKGGSDDEKDLPMGGTL